MNSTPDMPAEADAPDGEVDADVATRSGVAIHEHLRRLKTRQQDVLAALQRIEATVEEMRLTQYLMPRDLLTDIQALQQLLQRYAPQASLPRISGWALSPTGLLALTDIILSTSAETVVECGSGTSTMWVAYALRHLGRGKVIALEHLPAYAERTRQTVRSHGLEEYVEVRDAPLIAVTTPRGVFSWYDVNLETFPDQIDVLAVDGPPGGTGRHARYPALPMFHDRLVDGSWIFLDDVMRTDEAEILKMWRSEDPRWHQLDSPGPGLAVLQCID